MTTSEELARAIHARHGQRLRRGEIYTTWEKLSHQVQRRLVTAAECLAASWRAAGDPPSRGISSPDD